ncbi:MAG: deoxyribodipyrimidine photo-lyase [Ignavibacteria bacterium]|nr:deoxyribodipyrimidine photo-lyase [Ignavibacteria bacterium]
MLKIYWFRKDLRLDDNTALFAFFKNSGPDDKLSFIYTKNRNSFHYFGEKRVAFIAECLQDLSDSLRKFGYELQIFEGKSEDVFRWIVHEQNGIELYFNKQVEPYCIERDEKVTEIISNAGGSVYSFDDTTLMKPGSVTNLDGGQYKVYTPFKNQVLKQISNGDFEVRKVDFKKNFAEQIFPEKKNSFSFSYSENVVFKGGRKEGLKLLKEFYSSGISIYKSRRDFPDIKGTSGLSAHFHFGTVSIREAYRAALKKLNDCGNEQEKNEVQTWINELLWREFYYHITFSNPQIAYSSFKVEYDNVQWNVNEGQFNAWCEGKTGYPIVDAGMRQLKEEGWMHNRVRMITAMFLTKDLLIDWRLGEKYFARHLIDLDFSSNNGGWQWSASTGVDAQPYFRIFNPYLQSKKFDAEGNYIKKYVKELKEVAAEHIHEPNKMDAELQKKYGVKIGIDYPFPIVDHKKAKDEVLKRFGNVTGKIQAEL